MPFVIDLCSLGQSRLFQKSVPLASLFISIYQRLLMHPIHDTDVLLLLAVTLASKRKPATLDELVVALAMVQPRLYSEAKLQDAFARLSGHGLLLQVEGAYTLSADAQKLIASVPQKGEVKERIFRLKEKLAGYESTGSHPIAQPGAEELSAAIAAWKATLPPPTKSEVHEERKKRQRELERTNMARPSRNPTKH